MGILFNEVSRTDLRDGDHVYSWRTAYTYAHHGIFVGDDDVIHFTRGSGKDLGGPLGAGTSLINSVVSSSIPKQNLSCQRFPDSCGAGTSLINSVASSSIPKQNLSCLRFPDSCGLENGNSGVIRSCLDCFLEGGPVHRFEYGVSKAVFLAQFRGGTCTLAQSDPPDEVIHRAKYLHKNGFGNYDLFSNNCEDFAIYCKTGYIVKRNASGRSGQVAAMDGIHSAIRLAYDNRDMLNRSPCLAALMLIGNYFFKRYTADNGVRVDKVKVAVEDLALYLDSTTGIRVDKTKKVEDSAVYPASSTGTRVDKTMVRVEDVPVFLDSYNTGKKLPVEDLAAYPDSSTGIRVHKTKLPVVEDSAVYLESSTGTRIDKTKVPVEDVAVFLDSSTGKKSPVEDVAVVLDSSTGQNPLLAESSTCNQAISRNKSSKKQKKKLRQQHRRNSRLVQGVEDAAVLLDSSTGKKPPVEDLAVYLDSSSIGVEKTMVPVEDVTVFLDSSTGKKPLLEDLAAYVDSSTGIAIDNSESDLAISRSRSSKNQKKKRRQKQRRNSQLVEGPIPSRPILQEN